MLPTAETLACVLRHRFFFSFSHSSYCLSHAAMEASLKVTYFSYSMFETPEEFYTAVSMDQRACSFWALLIVTLLGKPHSFFPLCPCAEKFLPDFPGSQMPSPGGNLLGSQWMFCLCAGLHPGTYHMLLCYFSFPLEFIKDRTLSPLSFCLLLPRTSFFSWDTVSLCTHLALCSCFSQALSAQACTTVPG